MFEDNPITEIGFRYYRSIGEDFITIDLTKRLNIIIGPNNSGKSNIIRAMTHLGQILSGSKKHDRLSEYENWSVADKCDFYPNKQEYHFAFNFLKLPGVNKQRDITDKYYRPTIQFSNPENDIRISDYDGFAYGNSYYAEFLKSVLKDDAEDIVNNRQRLNTKEMSIITARHFFNKYKSYIPSIHPISATRRIENHDIDIADYRNDGKGANYILGKWKEPENHNKQDTEKYEIIREFVRNMLNIKDLDISVTYETKTISINYEAYGTNIRRNINDLGTGVHQLIILAITCLSYQNSIILIEEPETNLHPRLQREMMRFLIDKTDNCYVISTHSNALLSYADDAKIISVTIDNEHKSCYRTVNTSSDVLDILRYLGVSAADLLQSCYVIWIEGPSDAIYIRKWLQLCSLKYNKELIEGIHFSFATYGGMNLSHFTLLQDEESESITADDESDIKYHYNQLINILKINQYCAVMIDSDKHNDSHIIRKAKQQIQKACIECNRICWITEGREIENYLSNEDITKCLIEYTKHEDLNIELGQYQKIEEAIRIAMRDNYRPKYNYDKHKVEISREIVKNITTLKKLDLEDKINELYKDIAKANMIDMIADAGGSG